MKKIFHIPSGTSRNPINYLIISDLHDLFCDISALMSLLICFEMLPKKNRRIILLGDIFNIDFAFKKNPLFSQGLKAKDFDGYFVPEMDKTIIWFESLYELLIKYVAKPEYIYFMEGNHEQRLTRDYFIDNVPYAYRHNFNLFEALECEKRKMPFFEYNTWLKLSVEKMAPMYLTHGQRCGANPIKKHFDLAHGSVLFGHTHETGIKSFSNIEHTILGYNNPCLCSVDAPYLEGKVNNWSVGGSFMSATDKHFFVTIQNVWDGETVFNGQKIKS